MNEYTHVTCMTLQFAQVSSQRDREEDFLFLLISVAKVVERGCPK
jgi:hypothetical protein